MAEEEGMTADEGPAMPAAADEARPDRRMGEAYATEAWSADMREASPAEAWSTDILWKVKGWVWLWLAIVWPSL